MVLVAAALVIGFGIQQVASGHNAARTEAAGDIPKPVTKSIEQAGEWLRQHTAGQRVMLLRSSLQERFELLSGLPGTQFIDDNDADFQFVRSGRKSPESVGIGWLVRLRKLDEGALPTAIPKALEGRIGPAPCATFGSRSTGVGMTGLPWVAIWRVGAPC